MEENAQLRSDKMFLTMNNGLNNNNNNSNLNNDDTSTLYATVNKTKSPGLKAIYANNNNSSPLKSFNLNTTSKLTNYIEFNNQQPQSEQQQMHTNVLKIQLKDPNKPDDVNVLKIDTEKLEYNSNNTIKRIRSDASEYENHQSSTNNNNNLNKK